MILQRSFPHFLCDFNNFLFYFQFFFVVFLLTVACVEWKFFNKAPKLLQQMDNIINTLFFIAFSPTKKTQETEKYVKLGHFFWLLSLGQYKRKYIIVNFFFVSCLRLFFEEMPLRKSSFFVCVFFLV